MKEMSEIQEFLTNMYNGASEDAKKRIAILLKHTQVDLCKCPQCGKKFTPDEAMKGGIIMYPTE